MEKKTKSVPKKSKGVPEEISEQMKRIMGIPNYRNRLKALVLEHNPKTTKEKVEIMKMIK